MILVAASIAIVSWIAASDGPFAQGMREIAGWKPDQVILDKLFSVGPHTFRYYKFALPEGSAKVAVVGQFTAEAQNGQVKEKDNGIAVYVLTEAAFADWQSGNTRPSIYDSGIVPASIMQADIPAGAGTYYLVFSNKASPNTTKAVHATVRLRYQNWLRNLLGRPT